MSSRSDQHRKEAISAEMVYRAIKDGGSTPPGASLIVALRHCFYELAEFDQRTGQALPRAMTEVLSSFQKLQKDLSHLSYHDRLHRIFKHCDQALQQVIRRLSDRLLREQAVLPLRSVRELDTGSFAALSRRPGRTVREKLAGKPYMQAIRRRRTCDTSENRLLKAMAQLLVELLTLRGECLPESAGLEAAELMELLEFWLVRGEADEIGRWDNQPPNNMLLGHQGYRRIWDAWLWMQSLDDDMRQDSRDRRRHCAILLFFAVMAKLGSDRGVRFTEQPCYFDYDEFHIRPALAPTEMVASANGLWISPMTIGKASGTVTVLSERNYCLAETADGRRVLCHENAFLNSKDFRKLREETTIRFIPEKDERGWKAREIVLDEEPKNVKVELTGDLILRISCGDETHCVSAEFLCSEGGPVKVEARGVRFSSLVVPERLAGIADFLVSQVLPRNFTGTLEPRNSPMPIRASRGSGVVDLSTLRPRFADENGYGTMPFRLLWQLWQQPGHGGVEIPLPACDAISLHSDVKTVSVLNLTGNIVGDPQNAAAFGQAARCFAGQIRRFLETESITYLVPDAVDDFTLEVLRKSLNSQFPTAEPLPRSIATAFDWQSTKSFARAGITPGDCVWVIDNAGSCLCITPLIAAHNCELEKRLPESRGIYWERCPSIHGSEAFSSVQAAIRALEKHQCVLSRELGGLCGLQGLDDEGDSLSVAGPGGTWFTIPCEIHGIFNGVQVLESGPWETATDGLEKHLGELPEHATIHVLPVCERSLASLLQGKNPAITGSRTIKWHTERLAPARGGMVLHKWQAAAGDVPLWRDRLPELSIKVYKDGRYVPFHLVKDATIAPKRGKAVGIPIRKIFTLEAGKAFYEFPLFQGAVENRLQFQAFLKSPTFPLREDTPCKLQMTFTYGADDPYELTFTPMDPQMAGFNSVRVAWQPKAASGQKELLAPPFPPRRSWSDLRTFQPGTDAPCDLLARIEQHPDMGGVFKALEDLEKARMRKFPRRSSGVIKTPWRGEYCFVKTNGEDALCHLNSFCENANPESLKVGDKVFFDLKQNQEGRLRCENTSFTEESPLALAAARDREYVRAAIHQARDVGRALRSLRSAFLTAWNHGHHLGETDGPSSLQKMLPRVKAQGLEVIARQKAIGNDDPVKEALTELADAVFYELCCLSADAPDEVYEMVRDMDSNGIQDHWTAIAFLIGDARQERQQVIWKHCLNQAANADRIWMQILGIAIWRAEGLVRALPPEIVEDLCANAVSVLESEQTRTIRKNSRTGQPYVSPYVVSKLELFLGLLRIRETENEQICNILAPAGRLARRLEKVIEDIDRRICEADIPLYSRISLKLEKPKGLRSADLLYALRSFLTGDSGARAIIVTGVDDDE